MTEPRWINKQALILLHGQSLAEHGGPSGVRDEGMLESALGRPVNQYAYGVTDIVQLAAAYGFGIARNHPFVDGNKRAAFIATGLFLSLNGLRFVADKADAYHAVIALAADEIGEEAFAGWLRKNTQPKSA